MAGQPAGGSAGAVTGGQSGAGAGGQLGSGGTTSGGAAGSNVGGKSVGGANQAGGGASGGASRGGSAGIAGASQGGSAGKGGASQGGASSGGAAGKGGGGAGGSGPSGCKGGKVVHFVYFVESDQTYSESQRADIEGQAFKFQEYWFGQLGSTFYLAEPVVEVIRADNPARWYMDTASGIQSDPRWWRLDNVMKEVHRKLGIRNNDPNRRLVNYPVARFDGHVGASNGGAWMDGDDLSCIPTNGVNYPYPPPQDSPAHCMGHVAHEFGHILGLGHEGPQDNCMIYGFYQPLGGPMCDFGSANVAKIKAASSNTGWLNARPGQTCAL